MIIEGEECKFIEGTDEFYAVSVTGKVWSFINTHSKRVKTPKRKVPNPKENQYVMVRIRFEDGITRHQYVHRLVAKAFIPNPNNLPQVNHKNEIKTDNRVENLEWCTNEYNLNYGTHNARVSASKRGVATRTGKYTHKISNEDIMYLRTVEKLSIKKIADKFNVSFCCIHKRCKSMGIN